MRRSSRSWFVGWSAKDGERFGEIGSNRLIGPAQPTIVTYNVTATIWRNTAASTEAGEACLLFAIYDLRPSRWRVLRD